MSKEVERLQELIDQYDNIVFFGGAGVSTESGIPPGSGSLPLHWLVQTGFSDW